MPRVCRYRGPYRSFSGRLSPAVLLPGQELDRSYCSIMRAEPPSALNTGSGPPVFGDVGLPRLLPVCMPDADRAHSISVSQRRELRLLGFCRLDLGVTQVVRGKTKM